MNLMAVIVVFRFLMSASEDTLALHLAFSVAQTAKTPSSILFLGCGLVQGFLALLWTPSRKPRLRILRCLVLSFCV
jgi:hypothetical protein